MLGRGRKPRVLARVPVRLGQAGSPGSLDRAELQAYAGLWAAVGDTGPVLVTGGEEKSAVALGLASAAAAVGRRAALVECDLARPVLATTLGLAGAPGLAEYLEHEAEAPQILQAAVLAGPATGPAVAPLVCIVGGMATQLGPALLASESFGHAIGKLRNAYEVVVVLGPALDDERSLFAAAAPADTALACSGSRLPRRMRDLIDGLVELT